MTRYSDRYFSGSCRYNVGQIFLLSEHESEGARKESINKLKSLLSNLNKLGEHFSISYEDWNGFSVESILYVEYLFYRLPIQGKHTHTVKRFCGIYNNPALSEDIRRSLGRFGILFLTYFRHWILGVRS